MSKDQFRGFQKPTTTAVPDEIFDELMSELSGAELKVLLYICRRTFGFKKNDDNIAISQMLKGIVTRDGKQLDRGVGLSKPTLLRAIKALTEQNIVVAERRSSQSKGFQATNYRLNFLTPLGKKTSQGESQNLTKPLGKKSAIQQTVEQQTVEQQTVDNTVNGVNSGQLLKQLPNLDLPADHVELIATDIINALGDQHSKRFYRLVAAKCPERVICRALSEIKADGAKHPPKVFTARMGQYALEQLKRRIG